MKYWRRQWHPTPVLLPGKPHGWRSLVGYSPWGLKESDTTEQLHSLNGETDIEDRLMGEKKLTRVHHLLILPSSYQIPLCNGLPIWMPMFRFMTDSNILQLHWIAATHSYNPSCSPGSIPSLQSETSIAHS